MNAYVYHAALYCEPCATKLKAVLKPHADSGQYPQGPYPEGGGESDSPQYCDVCEKFLENPLTAAGRDYIREAVFMALDANRPKSPALKVWKGFYGVEIPQREPCDG